MPIVLLIYFVLFITGATAATCAVTSESPSANESNLGTAPVSLIDDANEDRDAKKNDVQTTMDFAANIEKVKEVIFTQTFSNLIAKIMFSNRMMILMKFQHFLNTFIVRVVLGTYFE